MNFFHRLFIVGAVISALSCGFGPPKEMKPESLLDFAEKASGDIVAALNDFSAFDMTKPYWLPNPLLWYFSLSHEIRFIKLPYPSSPDDSSILCRLGRNGEIILDRDFYFTLWGDVLAYSFDGKIWYATDGDPREYEAFVPDIRLHPKRIPTADTVSFMSRKIATTEPNLVCYSTDRNDYPVDLRKSVFFVPKGTSVGFRWDVESNFISLHQTDFLMFQTGEQASYRVIVRHRAACKISLRRIVAPDCATANNL